MTPNRVLGFAVGPIVSALIGLATVPVIAWLFSPAEVGRLNVFQVTLSFALLFSVLGLDQAYVREFHESGQRQRLLLSCFLPGFILLLACAVPILFFSSHLAVFLYDVADSRLIWLTFFAFVVTYVSRFLSLILRMHERGWAYSASQVLPKILSLTLVLCVPLFDWGNSFRTLQIIVVAGLLAVMLVYAWNTRLEWRAALKQRIDIWELRRLLAFGLPLILSGLAYWGLTATSTYSLRHWSTLEELAIYSVTNSFAGAAVIFQSIFATIWAPTVYKWVAQGVEMDRVDSVARHALVIVVLIMTAAGVFSWITDLLLPAHYYPVKYLLASGVAPTLLYTLSEVTAVGIGISRRTSWAVWITISAFVTNILLSWWLIPKAGAVGAVISNAVAFFTFFVLRTEVSAMLWRQFPRVKIYLILLINLSTAIIMSVYQDNSSYVRVVVWISLGIVNFVLLHQEVVDLWRVTRAGLGGLRALKKCNIS